MTYDVWIASRKTTGHLYQNQSAWIIPDKDLQQRVCHLVVQAIVPVYRSFMQNYGPHVEQDISASKYVKYSAEGLDKMLSTLFMPKLRTRRTASMQIRNSNGKIASAVTGLQRSASTLQ